MSSSILETCTRVYRGEREKIKGKRGKKHVERAFFNDERERGRRTGSFIVEEIDALTRGSDAAVVLFISLADRVWQSAAV